MSEEKGTDDLSKWFSSYGLITVERLLGKYNIRLDSEDLIAAVKNPKNFYYHILRAPVKNVLNGLILAQAKEYHLYLQKLFIDYLLSGEASKDETFPGAETREDIAELREAFVESGKRFLERENAHNKLIANSQAYIINFLKEWLQALEQSVKSSQQALSGLNIQDIKQACFHALVYSPYSELTSLTNQSVFIKKMIEALGLTPDDQSSKTLADLFNPLFAQFAKMDESLAEFCAKIDAMSEEFRANRSQFYTNILQVTEILSNLSDYKFDPEQLQINKQALDFDKGIV